MPKEYGEINIVKHLNISTRIPGQFLYCIPVFKLYQ